MIESGAPTKLVRPKTAAKKKREKAGRNFLPRPPSAPPALRSRAWGGI